MQVVLEESKEADRTTGQATHRISRGINDKVFEPAPVGNWLKTLSFYDDVTYLL